MVRGAGFSRWAGWGDHRHPIQFSGDAVGNWEVLRFEIELTATSGNAGCFFWAHDLAVSMEGKTLNYTPDGPSSELIKFLPAHSFSIR
ncbi:MAG: TIM-barrel domain-containing protein [Odoribacter sp.]